MKLSTGKVAEINHSNTTTVCIPNDALEVNIHGSYREIERKLWAYLVHNAFESNEFGEKRIHEAKCSDVVNVFKSLTGNKDAKTLWKYINRLGDIKVTLKSGAKSEGFTHLLAFAEVNYEQDRIRYQIPAILESFIESKNVAFSRIRTHFLIGLRGKYSVSLYMLLERYANRKHPYVTMTLDELKEKLKVEPGKFEKWGDLKRRVLMPAVEEINDKTEVECFSEFPGLHGAGFSVTFEPDKIGQGVKVSKIRFDIKKNEKRESWEKQLRQPSAKKENNSKLTLRWPIVIKLLDKHGVNNIDKYAYYDEWNDWLQKSNKSTSVTSPEASYVGFIKKKLR